jgi:hypothetical protein
LVFIHIIVDILPRLHTHYEYIKGVEGWRCECTSKGPSLLRKYESGHRCDIQLTKQGFQRKKQVFDEIKDAYSQVLDWTSTTFTMIEKQAVTLIQLEENGIKRPRYDSLQASEKCTARL